MRAMPPGWRKGVFEMRLLKSLVCAAALSCVAIAPAAAKPSTKERVTALEAEVAELRAAAAASAAATQRVDSLETEIRSLTGRVETLNFQLQQANAQIRSMGAALAGEPVDGVLPNGMVDPNPNPFAGPTGGPAPLSPAGPTSLTGQPAPSTGAPAQLGQQPDIVAAANDIDLPLDPEAAFAYANGFLLRQDFARAEAAYSEFVAAYGSHPRAADAQFRLGEIYLARGKNAEAADAFVGYIGKYPNSQRTAEAYLKLGAAFAGLGEVQEACKVLRAVKSKYPGAQPQVLDRADRELRRNGCS